MIIIFLYYNICGMKTPHSKSDAKLQKNTNMINLRIFKKGNDNCSKWELCFFLTKKVLTLCPK